ncbi:MAG: hypothetical protein SVR08_17250, partial [Spirochaetota bacterium]|nr:hypothetical protein [Spirochaetota bacterium]
NFCTISKDGAFFKVRHYNVASFPEEKHPLVGIVKRSERPGFRSILKSIGIENPISLKNIVNTTHHLAGYEIIYKKELFGKIYIDKVVAERFGIESKYVILKLIINNFPTSDLTSEDISILNNIVVKDLYSFMPNLNHIEISQYRFAFKELEKQIPFFKTIVEFPVISDLLEIIVFSFFGFVVLMILYRKRLIKD